MADLSRITELKTDLKAWEHAFAKANSGKKPSTADIKADSSIAAKYKEYSKLSKSSKPAASSNSSSRTSKPTLRNDDPFAKPVVRTNSNNDDPFARPPSRTSAPPVTPNKSHPPRPSAAHETPTRSTGKSTLANADIYESPVSVRRQRLFGNRTTRDAVGPTPQKAGLVLGIFDQLATTTTPPSPSSATKPKTPFDDTTSTPSRQNVQRVSASPAFATPTKRKLADTASPLRRFETPSGLKRRAPLESAGESPMFRPRPRPTRGLSSMINELRELEEHEHDDEEEAMREMEAEEMGLPAPPRKDNGRVKKVKVDKDGFDREPELPPLPPGAYVDEEGVDEDEGKKVEGRTYKKKGLKRQTKRVKMKPVTYKTTAVGGDETESGSEKELQEEVSGEESNSDYEDVVGDDDLDALAKSAKRIKKKQELNAKAAKEKAEAEAEQDDAKKPARKFDGNTQNRQNFRKLNIRGKNLRPRGGGGRSSGRRR